MWQLVRDMVMIMVFSSCLVSLIQIMFINYDLKLNLTKKQWIINILIMTVLHGFFRAVFPHIIFPFVFFVYSFLIFLVMYKVKIKKLLISLLKYFALTLIIESFASILYGVFKVNLSSAELNIRNLLLSYPIFGLEFLTVLFLIKRKKRKEKNNDLVSLGQALQGQEKQVK